PMPRRLVAMQTMPLRILRLFPILPMQSHVTRGAQRNQIRWLVVQRISIPMMNLKTRATATMGARLGACLGSLLSAVPGIQNLDFPFHRRSHALAVAILAAH